jgi:hypothetical protein
MSNFTIETAASQPPTRLARDAASATLGEAKNDLLKLRDCYHGPTARRTIEILTQGLDCAVEALEKLPIPPEVQRGR